MYCPVDITIPIGIMMTMESLDNRTILKRTALRLFAVKGYDSVGVQEIVRKCGVTKPTLYHYYGSKEGLFESILEEEFGRFFIIMKNGLSYKHNIVQSLQTLTADYLHFAEKNRDFITLLISLSFHPRESGCSKISAPFIQKFYKRIVFLFEQAAEDHGNMKNRQSSYALTFISMLNACFTLALWNDQPLTDEAVRLAVHQFMHGIFS